MLFLEHPSAIGAKLVGVVVREREDDSQLHYHNKWFSEVCSVLQQTFRNMPTGAGNKN